LCFFPPLFPFATLSLPFSSPLEAEDYFSVSNTVARFFFFPVPTPPMVVPVCVLPSLPVGVPAWKTRHRIFFSFSLFLALRQPRPPSSLSLHRKVELEFHFSLLHFASWFFTIAAPLFFFLFSPFPSGERAQLPVFSHLAKKGFFW